MNNKNNRGRELVSTLLAENPNYADILTNPEISVEEGIQQLRERILIQFQEHPKAFAYYNGTEEGEKAFFKLSWRDFFFFKIFFYL